MIVKLTKTLEVECRIVIDADEARRRKRCGECVWSWCTSGLHNWVETRIARADIVAYLVPPDHISLPPDSWRGLEELPVEANHDD